MNKTTVKELKEIIKTIKLPKQKKFKAKYIHTVTPELQAAIKDEKGFLEYLKQTRTRKEKLLAKRRSAERS